MPALPALEQIRLERDADELLWCHIDAPGESINILTEALLAEIATLIGHLEQALPRGVVLLSTKANGFIAGADVRAFTRIAAAAEAERAIREVHAMFARLEQLACPTLALIHGFCLGGGLELALACRYRVARDDPSTRIGFPEVLLGIFPGFGGSMRSVRQIGAAQALELMLTGRAVDARRAARLGLVDRAVPERQMRAAARALLLEAAPRPSRAWRYRLMEAKPIRQLLAKYLRRQVRARADPGHYPAPYALIDHWQHNGGDETAMLHGEATGVARLLTGKTSRNLVRAYLLQERMKGLGRGTQGKVERVHVIGAGVMGGDIAAWCAAQGLHVTLQDREPRFIAPAMARAPEFLGKRLKDPRLVQAALDRLMPDLSGTGLARADVVIEAIIEQREAKLELLRAIEPRLKDTAILSTNTSSIALEALHEALRAPERLVGIHFFNPVARMQLVEVVRGAATDETWVSRASAFCTQIGKLPLPVQSAPGFLVNRVLTPYLLEATVLLESGLPAEAIDQAAVAFGMPMGPVELADTVGLDVCLAVARNMAAAFGLDIPAGLEQRVQAGQLGRKSGRGFYRYAKGKTRRKKVDPDPRREERIAERLILRLLNECAACLREGIVTDADWLDAGLVFGAGFAPHHGGPMHYAAGRGHAEVAAALAALERQHGPRFAPDRYWSAAAE
jgi:3-hydroxyacyl-CoA dehydrogenase/enoyl-CoA hydratase/3-hydroxybutyryl-CoA epimerase